MKRFFPPWIATAAVVLLLIPPALHVMAHADEAPTDAASASVLVQEATVQQRTLDDVLHVYGQVRPDPAHVQVLAALGASLVRTVQVTVGQRVVSGQSLLAVEAAPQARRDYAQAQAQWRDARTALAQTRALYRQQLATRAQLAAAEQAQASAVAALRALQAQGAAGGMHALHAAGAGIVTRIDVAPGTRVQAGQPLLVLAGQDALQVRLGLEPQDVSRVRTGMPVRLQPVFGGAPLEASIERVAAAVDPATHLVDAVAGLSGRQADALVAGTWMKGAIRLSAQRTLAVPRSAVLSDAHGTYVFVVVDGHARRVPVQGGIVQDGWMAVRGTLAAGQRVVTAGNYELRTGMAVRTATEPAR